MNYWDSDSVWEGDHDYTSSLSKTLACLAFDDSNLSEEMRNRLRSRALYVLQNCEFNHLLSESETNSSIDGSDKSVYYAADGMHYDDESYLSASLNNAKEWCGLKLMIKNIIDLEDFIEKSERAPVLALNDDQLRLLVDRFIYVEYVNRMKNTDDYPFGTSKSISLYLRLLNKVDVKSSSKIVKIRCTCPGFAQEFEVDSKCDICRSHEDDYGAEMDFEMAYSEVCEHYFHWNCIIKHLQLEGLKTCPTCRGSYLPQAEFPEWIHNMKKVKACFSSDVNNERGGPFIITLSHILHILNALTVLFLQNFNVRDGAKFLFEALANRLLQRIGDDIGGRGKRKRKRDMDESQGSSSSVECLRSGIMKILKESKKSVDDDSFMESFITQFIPCLFQKYGLECEKIEVFGRKLKASPPGSDLRMRVQSCLIANKLYSTLRGVVYVNLCRQSSTVES